MDLIKALSWRYAVKKFNNVKVDEEKIQKILEATRLSASSIGLQPYRVFVIKDDAIRQELGADSFNAQIVQASHLLAFAAFDSINLDITSSLIALMAKERDVSISDLDAFKNAIEGYLLARTDEENYIWASKQAYIALGTALIAAADLEVDSVPMEGFNADRLDQLLNLKEKGLKSVFLLGLGYREASIDSLAGQKKVRLPMHELVTEI